jgi:class 3 adenylate cyclase
MDVPPVRFLHTDDGVRIGYQDYGTGSPVVFVQPFLSHLEGLWQHELNRRHFERMSEYLRILTFDQRGSGLSDRTESHPTLEQRLGDIKLVMEAAGVERASLMGWTEGALMAIAFTAQNPNMVDRLVVANTHHRIGTKYDGLAEKLNPDPPVTTMWKTDEDFDAGVKAFGTDEDTAWVVKRSPSLVDHPDYVSWIPRYMRLIGPGDVSRSQMESLGGIDISGLPERVEAHTLITHSAQNSTVHVGFARALDQLIPNSTLIEYDSQDFEYWLNPNWRDVVDTHIGFITGREVGAPTVRRFAVVMFTDIVESTASSLATGDKTWHEKLDAHDRIADGVVASHGGTIVKSTGDGLLATFAMPSQAIDAAVQLRATLADAGFQLRVGIHAGEVEVRGDDVSGAVVNLASRVEQAAGPGDIYTTTTVRDLLIGADRKFEDLGHYSLKGFDREWLLCRLNAP